jgi:hypothetical protein
MGYKVVAPLVIVKDKDGAMHHVYQDGFLPDSADPDHVKDLVAGGMVESDAKTRKSAAKPADSDPASGDQGSAQSNK